MIKLKPLLICAPSGCGKGTLINRLLMDFPEFMIQNVSFTTRSPREGEVHGVHRHFLTEQQFKEDIDKGKFLEYNQYAGNLYGSQYEYIQNIIDQKKLCVIEVEIEGAKAFSKSSIKCNFLFVRPPSIEVLEERLRGRGTENDKAIQKRIERAKIEIDIGSYSECQKQGIYSSQPSFILQIK